MADPGFPIGGRRPPTQAFFGENVCENERIGSRRKPPRSANAKNPVDLITIQSQCFFQ